MSVEVGSLGFASHSLSKAYGTLCITGGNKEEPQEAAEKASRWLWLKRGEPWGKKHAILTQDGI